MGIMSARMAQLPDKNSPLLVYDIGVYTTQMLTSTGSLERKPVRTFAFL